VNVEYLKIPFTFQLVGKQVDICDGILGRDFLEHAGAQICYGSETLTLGTGSRKISKAPSPINSESKTKGIRRFVLPSRTELRVRLPIKRKLLFVKVLWKNRNFRRASISREP
jgi:hypothetical protein